MKRKIKTHADLETDVGTKPGADKKRKRLQRKSVSPRKSKQQAVKGLALAIALGFLSAADASQALTITNGDFQEHNLSIVENGKTSEHVLQPSQTASSLCASSCEIFIGADPAPYDAMAGEIATITDGMLVFQDQGPVKAGNPGSKK